MKEKLQKASVRWNDGSYDHIRVCTVCNSFLCEYPVYNEWYKEVIISATYLASLNGKEENALNP